ncbi:MAG: hypothetical protein HC900_11370, partial [Methylacidiphilales bacterium]|nr:hypothetical protein [Candidatus Methylacidiphilales bacterium]
MEMRIDEARHGDTPPPLDHPLGLIGAIGAHDAVPHDGDIGVGQRAGQQVKKAHVLEHQIGRLLPATGDASRFRGFTTNIFLPDGSDLFDPDYVYLGGDVTVSGYYLVPA